LSTTLAPTGWQLRIVRLYEKLNPITVVLSDAITAGSCGVNTDGAGVVASRRDRSRAAPVVVGVACADGGCVVDDTAPVMGSSSKSGVPIRTVEALVS
jgi:hypothetical protein